MIAEAANSVRTLIFFISKLLFILRDRSGLDLFAASVIEKASELPEAQGQL
jgi:hypothetical protein